MLGPSLNLLPVQNYGADLKYGSGLELSPVARAKAKNSREACKRSLPPTHKGRLCLTASCQLLRLLTLTGRSGEEERAQFPSHYLALADWGSNSLRVQTATHEGFQDFPTHAFHCSHHYPSTTSYSRPTAGQRSANSLSIYLGINLFLTSYCTEM